VAEPSLAPNAVGSVDVAVTVKLQETVTLGSVTNPDALTVHPARISSVTVTEYVFVGKPVIIEVVAPLDQVYVKLPWAPETKASAAPSEPPAVVAAVTLTLTKTSHVTVTVGSVIVIVAVAVHPTRILSETVTE